MSAPGWGAPVDMHVGLSDTPGGRKVPSQSELSVAIDMLKLVALWCVPTYSSSEQHTQPPDQSSFCGSIPSDHSFRRDEKHICSIRGHEIQNLSFWRTDFVNP